MTSYDLTDVFQKSRDRPGYETLIVFNYSNRRGEFMREISQSDIDASVNVRKGTIRFKNGSIIRAMSVTQVDDHQSDTFHSILMDEEVPDSYIKTKLYPLLIPYIPIKDADDTQQDSLSIFLNEFTVRQEGDSDEVS